MYNGRTIDFVFSEYYLLIDKHSIWQEIGDFKVDNDSHLIRQIIEENESKNNLKYLVFYESWENIGILEIVYEYLTIEYVK